MIDQLLNVLKGVVKIKSLTVDSAVFRLHYRFTAGVLFLSSLLLSATQYFGDPIDCETDRKDHSEIVDVYCWTGGTYSVVSAFDKKVGVDVPYHGIGKSYNQEKVHHAYYQWVGFFLLGQAILFYLPRHLWKMCEGGKVAHLIQGLDNPIPADKENKKEMVIDYLTMHAQLHHAYVIQYLICEVFNFINVVGQIYLVDQFLGGEFTQFGVKIINHSLLDDTETRTDPMIRVFPRRTKCDYHTFGPGGDVTKIDAYCILPLNIINEKVFVFMWFWFVILAIATAVMLLILAFIVYSPAARAFVLKSRCPLVKAEIVSEVTAGLNLGDWFLVYMLSKNLAALNMSELMVDLCNKIRGKQFFKHRLGNELSGKDDKIEMEGYSKENLSKQEEFMGYPYDDTITRV